MLIEVLFRHPEIAISIVSAGSHYDFFSVCLAKRPGGSADANPQPKSHQPRVLTQQFSRFFSSTWGTLGP